jgi:CheY-like chemotaxis protein
LAVRRNHILIVEDDEGLMQVLQQAFQKQGHTVYATARPAEAEELIQTKPVGIVFLDCLLPELSGVDLAKKIRERYSPAVLEIILMSGIFVDQGTVKENLRQAQAQAFLKKPFELKEAITLLPESTALREREESHPRRVLYQMFGKGKVTIRDKKKSLEALEELHGFDLPFVLSLLVEARASGHLNIVSGNGKLSGITFAKGHITATDIPDKASYIGKLLVELGYLSIEDLELNLRESKQKGQRLGEYLVGGCVISPHSLALAVSHQMGIRLSMLVADEPIHVNFVDAEAELTQPHIDPETFTEFVHDWIASRISVTWLKNHFFQWNDSTLVKTPLYVPDHPALHRPLIEKLEGFTQRVTDGRTLGEILEGNMYNEEALLKALHFLLTRGLFGFGGRVKSEAVPERIKSLKKIKTQFQGKTKADVFEVMAQMVGGGDADPDFVIDEFAKLMGPIPPAGSVELNNLYRDLRKLAEEAFASAKSGEATVIREQKAKSEMEAKLKAASNFEDCKIQLEKGLYKPALESLKKIQEVDPHLEKLRLYIAWAKIGMLDGAVKKDKLLQEVEMDLLQVPPHEKLESLYHFVSGLLAKSRGQAASAKKYFEKVVSMDAKFLAARRELSQIKLQESEKKDIFSRDLTQVVGSIFKRK